MQDSLTKQSCVLRMLRHRLRSDSLCHVL